MTTTPTTPATVADLSGTWTLDPAHTRIGFVARHAMVTNRVPVSVDGRDRDPDALALHGLERLLKPERDTTFDPLVVTHRLRAHHDAILVGIGTLLADDPQLNVRLAEGPNPQPVIVDSHLRTPLNARIWTNPRTPWIATLDTGSLAAKALIERGAKLIQLPADDQGQVDLAALFAYLGAADIRSVMVEGGAAIITNMMRQQLAHYAVVTVAPRFLPGVRVNSPTQSVVAALQEPSYTQAGSDIIVWGDLDWTFAAGLSFSQVIAQNNFATSPTVSSTL